MKIRAAKKGDIIKLGRKAYVLLARRGSTWDAGVCTITAAGFVYLKSPATILELPRSTIWLAKHVKHLAPGAVKPKPVRVKEKPKHRVGDVFVPRPYCLGTSPIVVESIREDNSVVVRAIYFIGEKWWYKIRSVSRIIKESTLAKNYKFKFHSRRKEIKNGYADIS